MVALAAFSLGVGWYSLLWRHGLYADLGYDDGVWFGSAVRIANGVLPYRGFVMDQPPGVPLLMAPFGLLSRVVGTREAFGAARLVVPCVEAVTVVATGWLVRHRGCLVVGAACGVAAIYPSALLDQRTVMLEPFCAMFCMLGLVGVFDGDRIADRSGRLVLAGTAFGLAGSCKAFAALPLAAVVVVLLVAGPDRGRRLLALLAGAAGTFAVVCGPFLVLAPTQWWHQVVAAQVGRSQKVEPGIWDRVFSLVGLVPATGADPRFADDSHPADVVLVAIFAAVVLGGWAVARRGRRRGITQLDLAALGVVVFTAIGLVEPPAYYDHYAAFFGPFLAVPLGLSAGYLSRRLPRLVAIAAAVAVIAGGVHAVHSIQAQVTLPYNARVIDESIPPGACVVSDDAAVLVLADRFTSHVAGCSQMVDTYGTTISADHGYSPLSPEAGRSPAVGVWVRVFAHADYVVLTQRNYARVRIPWTTTLRQYLRRHFRTVVAHPLIVLVRDPG